MHYKYIFLYFIFQRKIGFFPKYYAPIIFCLFYGEYCYKVWQKNGLSSMIPIRKTRFDFSDNGQYKSGVAKFTTGESFPASNEVKPHFNLLAKKRKSLLGYWPIVIVNIKASPYLSNQRPTKKPPKVKDFWRLRFKYWLRYFLSILICSTF